MSPAERDDSPSCKPEIEHAIHDLSDRDWYRLRRVGSILSLKVPNLDGEGLLFEALERTLSGRRRWNSSAVDFVGHLVGVMRSMASHVAKRQGFNTVALTSSVEMICDEDLEAEVSAQQQIWRLRTYFGQREDQEALQVLDAMELGCDGPMIRSQFSLSQTKLETIVRRIRRAAERAIQR